MNNENNNGTVLGNINPDVSPNPIPNPTPVNGVENLNGNSPVNANPTPTPEVNPIPASLGPVPEPVNMNPNPSPNLNSNDSLNNNQAPVQPTVGPQPTEQPVQPPIPPQPSVDNSVPPAAPQPAYTNPQAINQNTIGTTPPISYEPEKKPKMKKNNKILFIIIIVLVLALVGFGTYYVLNYTDLINKSSSTVTISTKNLEFEMGNALSDNVADYAEINGTSATNCTLDKQNVDITKAGVYEYTVTCGETQKTGKITIIDNSPLKVTLADVYKVKGENLEAKEFAEEGSNYNYEFVDNSEVEKYLSSNPGTYTIKIRVTDNNTNKNAEVDGNLIILSNPLKGFLTCSSKEQNVENSNAKMIVNERFAILDGSTVANAYGNVTYEIYQFTYTDDEEFQNLLNAYNTTGTVSINNITGKTVVDETNKTITITNLRKNEDVIAEYGADNLQNYTTIKKYFSGDTATNTQGLGYECNYEKSNK